MNIKSLIKHLFLPHRFLVRDFSKENLQAIELKIKECEKSHSSQIVFAYQAHKKLIDVLKNTPSRELAMKQFARLGVWDTEANSGILFYLLLADHSLEIIADRGISKAIPQEEWNKISDKIGELLKTLPMNEAVIKGIELISEKVGTVVPREAESKNELSDKPIKL